MDRTTCTPGVIRQGEPTVIRSDRYGFDRYTWPSGLTVYLYDDGRVKVGAEHHQVSIEEMRNHAPGENTTGGGHATIRVTRRLDAPAE